MKYKIYFFSLGMVSSFFGLISVLAVLHGKDFIVGIIGFPSDIFRGGWGGVILLFSGLFYIHGIKKLEDIHRRAELFIGSAMIWILGGSEILRIFLESIPGEEGWFNSFENFLSHYFPPYHPSILLLPFSLVILLMERYYGEKYSEKDSRRYKRKER